MAVAKERVPVQEVVDRIPHPKIQYAFLEVRVTGTVEEFLAFRSELLRKHPLYAESALAKQPPGATPEAPLMVPEDALDAAEAFQADVDAAVETPTSEAEPAASAPTDAKAAAKAKLAAKKKPAAEKTAAAGVSGTEGQSARDIARAKILAKKGA